MSNDPPPVPPPPPPSPPPPPICSILACYLPTLIFFASWTYGWRESAHYGTGRVYVALLKYGIPGTICAGFVGVAFLIAAIIHGENPAESISFWVALLILGAASLTYCST